MKELDFTQEELAKKIGITRSAVAHYVHGTRQPPLKQMIKLATVLKTDPAWLQFGKSQETSASPKPSHKNTNSIPILEWHQIYDYSSDTKYTKKMELLQRNVECYAVQIKTDAMISSAIGHFGFIPNSFAIIDPNKSPEHGNFVIATLGNKREPILRQYVEEGGLIYLKPLNTQYKLIQLERSMKIFGVVISNIYFTY